MLAPTTPPIPSPVVTARRHVLAAAAGAAALLVPWGTAAAQTATPTASTRDLVDTAVAAGQFTTLAAALQAAGLVETLKGPGPFTVFAPTDAAFAKLPAAQLNAILADRALLTKLLTYHVAAGRLPASEVVARTSIATVEGEPVAVAAQGSTVVLNGNARVLATDVAARNGLIHVIDTVLVPPSVAAPAPPPAPADPTVARDGQTLAAQPASVQQLFRSTWGDQAATRWAQEHDTEPGRGGR